MRESLKSFWRRSKLDLRRDFLNEWEHDFFLSQRRFLPEPSPAEPETLQICGYWAQWVSRQNLRHPYAELLWIDSRGHRYWVFPAALLRGNPKDARR